MRDHEVTAGWRRWPSFLRAEKSASGGIASLPLSLRLRTLPALMAAFVLVFAPGCAHKQQELTGISGTAIQPKPPAQPRSVVQAEGRITLIFKDPSASQFLEIHRAGKSRYEQPSEPLEDIGKNVLEGAAYGGIQCLQAGPFFLACVPIFAPAGAILGVVYSVYPFDPWSPRSDGDDFIYWKEPDPLLLSKAMEEELVKQQFANHTVRYAERHGIEVREDHEGGINSQRVSLSVEQHCSDRYWATLEIGGLLVSMEETIAPYGLWQLSIQTRAKLTRTSDQAVLADGVFVYNQGTPYYVSGLMDDDAKLFREELNLALTSLSKEIIETLFIQAQSPSAVKSP